MRLSGDVQTVRDEQHGRQRDTAVSAWKKLWWHRVGHSISELSCYFFQHQFLACSI